MIRKYGFLFILIIVFSFYTEIVLGGVEYRLKCKNGKCNYSKNIGFGGGLSFGEIVGYCMNCNDFVCLQWESRKLMPDGSFSEQTLKGPEPIDWVWDLSGEKPRAIYRCPKCGKPFMAITNIEDLKYCPKCKQSSLQIEETGLLYD